MNVTDSMIEYWSVNYRNFLINDWLSFDCLHNYLNVSRIMVKRTNFPNKGTTSDVGGIISASKRKNTVNDSNILMERETWFEKRRFEISQFSIINYNQHLTSAGFLVRILFTFLKFGGHMFFWSEESKKYHQRPVHFNFSARKNR